MNPGPTISFVSTSEPLGAGVVELDVGRLGDGVKEVVGAKLDGATGEVPVGDPTTKGT